MHNLKDETIYKVLDESIGDITLNCGYHQASRASLDIINDVCCDYLKKIGALLRIAKDTEEWRDGDSDFVDLLERVFHQVNLPSAANLHQFICKMDAIKKHRSTQQLHQQQQQQQPTQPQNQSACIHEDYQPTESQQ